ncbi:hypothetical protein GCM10012290_10950 [Halolactibacillus alkaliphilus]|uniref:Stage III sporulation protein AD n=2 Tax=Halolactibacillus alkaliphilus TaxID=442899 RepID=A0A511X2Q1_9BACI|nr:SpoIIIAC/SpoIIIAD family protein [Halolactibacillus alkaliphilus]GEN57240.1 hypothetical protein HAL01_17040 [Halolactibacillus alkaliphilus]GGN68850.1 hypothetical protein GCM10012290_10950 [Halolactibacillus alkaliphilus]SFO73186.1 stage III sporulation protein AD [Halolactibacillus alkaliphilus]
MMEWLRLILLIVVGHLFRLLLKDQAPLFSFAIGIVVFIFVYLYIIEPLAHVFNLLHQFIVMSGVKTTYLVTIIKMMSISYIVHFFQLLLKDTGSEALGLLVELVGMVMLLVIAVPVIEDVLVFIVALLD